MYMYVDEKKVLWDCVFVENIIICFNGVLFIYIFSTQQTEKKNKNEWMEKEIQKTKTDRPTNKPTTTKIEINRWWLWWWDANEERVIVVLVSWCGFFLSSSNLEGNLEIIHKYIFDNILVFSKLYTNIYSHECRV